MGIYETSLIIYQTFLIPVIFFSALFYLLSATVFFKKHRKIRSKNQIKQWPFVSIQLPVYNDPVVVRCIEHCLKFDYPKNKFEILVADDSTDNTSDIIDSYAERFPDKIKVFRRNNRSGFKSGALNNLLKHTKGDIIVIFDSDFTPSKKFLKKIIRPLMEDEKLAFVQSRMGYINHDQNIITRLASTFMMIYHQIILPLNNRFGVIFFCGTGGAIRKSVLLEMGGWNEKSVTEDADLSIKMINAGYKTLYLPNIRVRGELPFTFYSFIKQQMRWAYGMTRVFLENVKSIWFHKRFSFFQRALITYVTIGNIAAPFVVLMTLGGIISMSTGTPHPLSLQDVINFAKVFLFVGGFTTAAFIALSKEKKLYIFKSVFFGTLTIGVLVSMFVTIALTRALLGMNMVWFRTPKFGSLKIIEIFKKYFKRWSKW